MRYGKFPARGPVGIALGVDVELLLFRVEAGGVAPLGDSAVGMRRGPLGGILMVLLRGCVGGFEGGAREGYEGERPVVL